MWTAKGKVCLAWSIYTFPVLHTHNKMFIFITIMYVVWNLFTVGNLQFCNDSTVASLKVN